MRMQKVIRHILDQVLELPPPSQSLNDDAVIDSIPDELAISSIFAPEDEPEFLEWLNSVDWTRDMLQDAWT